MLNDMAWRKTPRDLLTNPKIRTIARKFETALRPAVFAFYTAVYMQADDDGVVDLNERDVFAELLMVEDEDLILNFIEKFEEKGYLEKIGNTGSYYITDWDNPNKAVTVNGKRVAETAEQRRARVLGVIDGKPRRKKSVQDRKIPEPEIDEALPTHAEVLATLLENGEMHDKIQKNVATDYREREETIDTEIAEKDTHTETERKFAPPASKAPEAFSAGTEQFRTKVDTPEAGQEEATVPEQDAVRSTGEKPMQENKDSQWTFEDTRKAVNQMELPEEFCKKMESIKNWEDWQALNVIYRYFKDKSYPFFEQNQVEIDAMKVIIASCRALSEPKNAPYVIAGQLCRLYGDLVNQRGVFSKGFEYFQGYPAQPSSMIKPAAWSRIVAEARKVLSPGLKKLSVWAEEMEKLKKQIEKESETYNGASPLEVELKKHGLDPGKPESMAKLLAIQAAR